MTRLQYLRVADEPETWAALGFSVDGGTVWIGTVGIVCSGRELGRGIVDWTLVSDDGAALPPLDGLPVWPHPGPSSALPADHVNGVVAIDHVVVSTPDLERTVAAFESAGLECRRRREGAAYGAQRMRQAFFWLGDADGPIEQKVILEVVGPEEPDTARATEPARFFGLALTVRDLDSTLAFFGDLMKPPTDAVQPGRRITTISSRGGSSVAIAVMSPHPR
jgi:catechol 2,3-dioxygenase-like lactoylglutathione lyase family enzyme